MDALFCRCEGVTPAGDELVVGCGQHGEVGRVPAGGDESASVEVAFTRHVKEMVEMSQRLAAHRIPLASDVPSTPYLVCLDSGSVPPTEREVLLLASFLQEYILYWYSPSFAARLATRSYDVDGGANGVTFVKYGTDDWAYRHRSWIHPLFSPRPPEYRGPEARPVCLLTLLDHHHSAHVEWGAVPRPSPRWTVWKLAHPEVFPAPLAPTSLPPPPERG